MFLFDSLVYLFTVKHTYTWSRFPGENIGDSVLSRMYRDGKENYPLCLSMVLLTIYEGTIYYMYVSIF